MLELIDTILKGDADEGKLEILQPLILRVKVLPCIEREAFIQNVCKHLKQLSNTILKSSQLFLVFDIVASVLDIQCHSRTSYIPTIGYLVNAAIDCLQNRGRCFFKCTIMQAHFICVKACSGITNRY